MSACGMQYSDIVFEQTRSRVTDVRQLRPRRRQRRARRDRAALERFPREPARRRTGATSARNIWSRRATNRRSGSSIRRCRSQRFRTAQGRGGAGRGVSHRPRPRLRRARRAERGRVRQLARPHRDPAVEARKAGAQADRAAQAEAVGAAAPPISDPRTCARRRCSAAASLRPAPSSPVRRSSRSRPRRSSSIRG